MRLACGRVLIFLLLALPAVQATTPTVNAALPDVTLIPGGATATVDLRNYFSLPGVTGQVVQFDTVFGLFNVELLADAAPQQVANFITYVESGAYTNSFFHRAISFDGGDVSIVQGGGYRLPLVTTIPKLAAVPLEYNLPNARATLAAARGNAIDSATSEWYFNVRDNATVLGPANNGGYTVFGRVLGTGMTAIDAIAALPVSNQSGTPDPNQLFGTLPVRNLSGGNATEANLVLVNTVRNVALYPTAATTAILGFSIENSAPDVVGVTLSESTLSLAPINVGGAAITVLATDTNGNTAEGLLSVAVVTAPPAFTTQPVSQTVATGHSVVFRVEATAASGTQWRRNGVDMPDKSSATLIIRDAGPADAASYTCVASNAAGSTASSAATLVVSDVAATAVGRLVNLSILTPLESGETMTMGTVLGGSGTSGTKPMLIRAAGPSLAQFQVTDFLPDPTMTLVNTSAGSTVAVNDDWAGEAALSAAFSSVAAFPYVNSTSKDAAIFLPNLDPANYTVQVRDTGAGTGVVIAELYDSTPNGTFTFTTPRLVNVSVLKQINAGASLTVGFYVGGTTGKTVLIRAIGPALGLSPFNITTAMADPKLELFNGSQVVIAENNDWGGQAQLVQAGSQVAAFPIANGDSKDAMLLITLAPGLYTARVKPVAGGGTAIIEVYEVP